MKRFLLSILLFFVPLAVALFSFESAVRNIPNDYSFKNTYLESNVSTISVLILGSSHTYFGIQPRNFDELAFNAACVSQSLKYDEFILEKFIEKADSLQMVLLPISYFSLWFNLEDDGEWWRVKNYCIYYDYPYHKWEVKYRSEVAANKVKNLTKQLLNYYIYDVSQINCDSFGRGMQYNKANRSKEWWKNGKERAQTHTYDLKKCQSIFEDNKKYIEDIINMCYQKQIKVVLLTTPTCATYYENVVQEQLDVMVHFGDSISSIYDNTYYLNLLKDSRFIEDDFFDADHLNEFGAEKLTKILQQTIDSLGVLQN